jgi:hypothetical protein
MYFTVQNIYHNRNFWVLTGTFVETIGVIGTRSAQLATEMYVLWLGELVNSDNSVAAPDVNTYKTCNDWYLPATISVDGSNYSALVREIQSDHTNSATYQQLNSSRFITTALQSVLCKVVTGPFVLCLSLCSLQVVCFHVKHYLLQ